MLFIYLFLMTEGKEPNLICRADLWVDNTYVSEKRWESQELGSRLAGIYLLGTFGQARILFGKIVVKVEPSDILKEFWKSSFVSQAK